MTGVNARSAEHDRWRIIWAAVFWFTVGVLTVVMMIGLGGCRRGAPVIDAGPRPPEAAGTISGTVRGPEASADITGRIVDVINVATGERQRTTTNNAGGFTFKVKPGKYRVELTLREGEALVKQPGVLNVNESDVDAHADFVIGMTRASKPRGGAGARSNQGLGSPIA